MYLKKVQATIIKYWAVAVGKVRSVMRSTDHRKQGPGGRGMKE